MFALLREYGGALAGGAVNPWLGLPCATLMDHLSFWNVYIVRTECHSRVSCESLVFFIEHGLALEYAVGECRELHSHPTSLVL